MIQLPTITGAIQESESLMRPSSAKKPQLEMSRRLARKAKPRTRHLWGNGRGSFRTRGRYASATVRGTKWLVTDTCSGTLTVVRRGTVVVRDFVRRKNVTVRAGKRYLARAGKKK